MSMTSEEHHKLSMRIVDILPNNPDDALASIALTFANVVVSTGCNDEGAVRALRIALDQMRKIHGRPRILLS